MKVYKYIITDKTSYKVDELNIDSIYVNCVPWGKSVIYQSNNTTNFCVGKLYNHYNGGIRYYSFKKLNNIEKNKLKRYVKLQELNCLLKAGVKL
jgi:hypothetical protein